MPQAETAFNKLERIGKQKGFTVQTKKDEKTNKITITGRESYQSPRSYWALEGTGAKGDSKDVVAQIILDSLLELERSRRLSTSALRAAAASKRVFRARANCDPPTRIAAVNVESSVFIANDAHDCDNDCHKNAAATPPPAVRSRSAKERREIKLLDDLASIRSLSDRRSDVHTYVAPNWIKDKWTISADTRAGWAPGGSVSARAEGTPGPESWGAGAQDGQGWAGMGWMGWLATAGTPQTRVRRAWRAHARAAFSRTRDRQGPGRAYPRIIVLFFGAHLAGWSAGM
ncbi:hypothetical protein DFH11DRAFT_1730522 [Phellopilus nigrolimitatus]|nr:hypothetical protein DFH11DRAFT_1730522 [Phellopilus nigrolimitatus]